MEAISIKTKVKNYPKYFSAAIDIFDSILKAELFLEKNGSFLSFSKSSHDEARKEISSKILLEGLTLPKSNTDTNPPSYCISCGIRVHEIICPICNDV